VRYTAHFSQLKTNNASKEKRNWDSKADFFRKRNKKPYSFIGQNHTVKSLYRETSKSE
jgi:lipopolysaccharide biosynthesis protein